MSPDFQAAQVCHIPNRPLPHTTPSGFALDVRTTGSTFLGHDEFGRERFDTGRSPLGNLFFGLKYRNDSNALEEKVNTAAQFLLATWHPQLDLIVPVPPSNTQHRRQPVPAVARALSLRCQFSFCDLCVSKHRPAQPMKDQAGASALQGMIGFVFVADPNYTSGRRILLVDDLYRPGTTARTVTNVLLQNDVRSSAPRNAEGRTCHSPSRGASCSPR